MNTIENSAGSRRQRCYDTCERIRPTRYVTFNSGPELQAEWNAYHACYARCLEETPYTPEERRRREESERMRERMRREMELIEEPIEEPILNPPINLNVPRGTENTILESNIENQNILANFHGEMNRGRYYLKSTVNQLQRKNPYTRQTIRPTNLRLYRARLVGGKTKRRKNQKKSTRKRV